MGNDINMIKPSLYGIKNSNRDFSDSYYWGKNQFNSSFPAALACYMRDNNISPVYLRLNKKKIVYHDLITVDKLFNTKLDNNNLFFSFESRYEPFSKFVHDELVAIDLVVKDDVKGKFLRPLEIKLTTLPDNTTASLPEKKYGSELVVRSPTMRYMALSMADALQPYFDKIREIFEPICVRIRSWDNADEIRNYMDEIFHSLEIFNSKYCKYERPILVQPIWKTIGKSPNLADQCLDIFVWSDFALTRLFMDSALSNQSNKISRQQRAAIRLARFLFEISRTGKIYQEPIYDGMTLGNQTDKEFSSSGNKTHK